MGTFGQMNFEEESKAETDEKPEAIAVPDKHDRFTTPDDGRIG